MQIREIKQRVPMLDACAHYGIEVNSRGFALCPFHAERTPSMKVYEADRGWHCFGCGKTGDVIDFVADLFKISAHEAATKIARDFGLTWTRESRNRQLMAARDQWKAQQNYNARKSESELNEQAYLNALDDWLALQWICRNSPEELTERDADLLSHSAEIVEKLKEMEGRIIEYGNPNNSGI